jgi:RHS repeat-associated protein
MEHSHSNPKSTGSAHGSPGSAAGRDKDDSLYYGVVAHDTDVQKQLARQRQGNLVESKLKVPAGKLAEGGTQSGRIEINVQRIINKQRLRERVRGAHAIARQYSRSGHYLRDPVDSIIGEVILDMRDFVLPGLPGLQWSRHYGSQHEYQGVCGRGWETPGDARLVLRQDGSVLFHGGSGASSVFKSLPTQTTVMINEPIDGLSLLGEEGYYIVRSQDGLSFYFPVPKRPVEAIKLERVADGFGNSIQYFWDANGLREIRVGGERRIEVLSRQGRIESMTLVYPGEPARILVRYDYDGNGNLTADYDALDVPYRYAYRDNLLVRHTNRNGLSFYYEYDQYTPEGRCTYTHGDDGLYEGWFVYHDDRQLIEAIGTLGTTTFLYDERYLVLEETNPLGGVTRFEYDEAGRTTAAIDPDGHRTEYTYDGNGNTVRLTFPDGSVFANEYDALGNPSRMIDPNGAEWKKEWNDQGQLIREIGSQGEITQYRYDDRGQLIEYLDAQGNKTEFTFDSCGNLTGLTDAQGDTIQYSYDCLGKMIMESSSLQPSSSYQYDLKGRLVKALLSDGTTIACEYDAEDNLIAYQDGDGAVTRMEYCGSNVLKRQIQPDGQTVEYEYDKEEQLLAIVNQRGERYELKRDAAGRIIEEIDYWGQSRRYRYSAAGHLRRVSDSLGKVIHYQTDPLGQVLQEVIQPLPGTGHNQTQSFQYDRYGNLIACTNGETQVQREFDPEGRLVEEKQGNDFRVIYSYDPDGNRRSRTTVLETGGTTRTREVQYSYDKFGQVTGIAVDGHQPVAITWDTAGQVIEEKLGSEIRRSSQYNKSGDLVRQMVGANAGNLFEQEYCYDYTGKLTEKRDSVLGTDKFSYNSMGRIVSQIDPLGNIQKFLYDPAGDRLTTRVTEGKTDDRESIWERTGDIEGLTYRFDRAGNLVEREDAKEANRFVWDANQRLLESGAGRQTTYYRYDPLGRRISKQTGDTTVRFFWDGDTLLGELRLENQGDDKAETATDSLWARRREWVYYPGSFEPLVLIQSEGFTGGANLTQAVEEIYYYINDPNACPIRLINESGRVVWAAQYDAWGKVKQYPVKEVDQPLRMQGQYYDQETGLHYNYQRYYEPHLGVFVSQDPLGLVPGINPYQYGANIWSSTDPLGLCKQEKRPVSGEQGQPVNVAGDFLIPRASRYARRGLFYSVRNGHSGRVYVSTEPIGQSAFVGLVHRHRTLSTWGKITVLTGTHGDPNGASAYLGRHQGRHRAMRFYNEDNDKWGSKLGIKVKDISQMSQAQITQEVNKPRRVICAWCWSERSRVVLRGLGLPAAPSPPISP